MTTTTAGYSILAEAYARHWGPASAAMMLPVLQKVLLPKLAPGARLLDLCCGSGELARRLHGLGYRVTGVDATPELIERARLRVAEELDFVVARAEAYRRPGGFEAIVSLYDSLNHLASLEALAQVLAHCFESLTPGGWLVFDLNEERGFEARWRGELSIVEDDLVLVARSRYSAPERTGVMQVTLLSAQGGAWVRSDARFEERCFSRPDVLEQLRAAGFCDVECLTAEHDLALPHEVGRTFFICRKPG